MGLGLEFVGHELRFDADAVMDSADLGRDRSGRFEPRLEAFVPDARDYGRNELSSGRFEVDRPACGGRLAPDSGECFVARPVVGQFPTVRFEHRAIDLAEARPLVDHARLGGRRKRKRWRVGGIRLKGRRDASRKEQARAYGACGKNQAVGRAKDGRAEAP